MTRRRDLSSQARSAINWHMRGMSKRAAAKRAGYGPGLTDHNADRFWNQPLVQKELKRRRQDLARKADVDAAKLIGILLEIAELDVGELVDEGGKLRPIAELREGVRKALALTSFGKATKIKTEDRLRAVEMIARLAGLVEDKVKVTADAELAEALMAGRKRASLRNSP